MPSPAPTVYRCNVPVEQAKRWPIMLRREWECGYSDRSALFAAALAFARRKGPINLVGVALHCYVLAAVPVVVVEWVAARGVRAVALSHHSNLTELLAAHWAAERLASHCGRWSRDDGL